MAGTGSRREAIADAAVGVIADRGIRGLTHRAVDEAAGLPAGSTSYYFRSRAALLEAVVAHLVVVDQAAFAQERGDAAAAWPGSPAGPADPTDPATPGPDAPLGTAGPDAPLGAAGPDAPLGAAGPDAPLGAAELDALAGSMAAVIDAMLTRRRRYALARYACLLEAARIPALRSLLTAGVPFRAMAADLLRRAGAPQPDAQAADLVACLDGLLFDRLAGAGAHLSPPPGTAAGRERLRVTIRSLLAGMTGH
jgi:AcrR family transcriptional regulator